jgi:hypothetical protein
MIYSLTILYNLVKFPFFKSYYIYTHILMGKLSLGLRFGHHHSPLRSRDCCSAFDSGPRIAAQSRVPVKGILAFWSLVSMPAYRQGSLIFLKASWEVLSLYRSLFLQCRISGIKPCTRTRAKGGYNLLLEAMYACIQFCVGTNPLRNLSALILGGLCWDRMTYNVTRVSTFMARLPYTLDRHSTDEICFQSRRARQS